MDGDYSYDKINIKTLLFTKAIPSYTLPIAQGHKVFSCTDCGDRYIMESSYDYHVNRKSVKITYKCRHCGESIIFFNRCNLLSHIRSHAFKTATINVSDLKVEPLPVDFFSKVTSNENSSQKVNISTKPLGNTTCYECKTDSTNTGVAYKDRAKHYMQYTKALHSCAICMFTLPTVCALKAHLRLHLKTPPFYCPECGINLPNKSIHYPYAHDCEGFKMMRATARLICSIEDSHIFHPNEYNEHMKTLHLKKIYRCPVCIVVSFSKHSIQSHLNSHSYDSKPIVFYQCDKCSGKLIVQNQIDNHLRTHVNCYAYPCWTCGTIFKEVSSLINHHMDNHSQEINITKQLYKSVLNDNKKEFNATSKQDTVSNYKRKRNKIKAQDKQSTKLTKLQTSKPNKKHIICHLCKNKISQNWNLIKEHYANCHKSYKCVDIKIILEKLCINKYEFRKNRSLRHKTLSKIKYHRKNKYDENTDSELSSSSQPATEKNDFSCPKCSQTNENRDILEMHMITHRDPCMAYQCLECGQSFAVKPSFSTHLLLEHGISDVTDYIKKKQCYNENALAKEIYRSDEGEPIKENQCQICRDQFEDSSKLQKHFRVHGMAFLMKNTSKLNT